MSNFCFSSECHAEIQLGEKVEFVYNNVGLEHLVHAGECLERYKMSLTSAEAIKKGVIIGFCGYCQKPVREKDQYVVIRNHGWGYGLEKKEENPVYITLPSEGDISFVHKKCEDEYYAY